MAQAIITRYLPCTNTSGPRIKVSSWMATTTHSYPAGSDGSQAHLDCIIEHIAHIQNLASDNGNVVEYHIVMGDNAQERWDYMGATPDGKGYVVIVV